MKQFYIISIFIAFSCSQFANPKNSVNVIEYRFEEDLVFCFSEYYKVISKQTFKQDGIVTKTVQLGIDSLKPLIYIDYTLNKNNISWSKTDKFQLNLLKKKILMEVLVENPDSSLVEFQENIKIGQFVFLKIWYKEELTELYGSNQKYAIGISFYRDSNNYLYNSLKQIKN